MTLAPAPRCVVAAVVATASTFLAMPALAQRMGAAGEPQMQMLAVREASGRGGRSLSEAIRHVQRSTGGQILGAERVPFDGRDINRVKYLDGRGRVRYMDDPGPQRAPARVPRQADVPSMGATPPRDANR